MHSNTALKPEASSDTAALMRGLRASIIEAACISREGHIPSALSILDILWVLYDRVLNITPTSIHSKLRDRCVRLEHRGVCAEGAERARRAVVHRDHPLRLVRQGAGCAGHHTA